MPGKFYTVMVIPHTRGRYRNLRFSRRFAHTCVGLLVVLILATVALPRYLYLSHTQARSLDDLTQENETLRSANERYDADLDLLRSKLENYRRQSMKFALMAGVEDLPSTALATGSPGELPPGFDAGQLRPDYLLEELDILRSRVGVMDESYEILEQAYADRAVLLATTPSISPARGIIGSGFNWRRDPFTGEREFHKGLDIVANAGTPVRATADGVVVKAGRLSSYGKAVFLSHGNGLSSRYAHLSELTIKPGQKVKRGDILGRVGATGRAKGYHLHYEVLLQDKKVDPMDYILDGYIF